MSRGSLPGLVLLATLAGCGPSGTVGLPASGAPRKVVEPRLDATTPLSIERLGRRLKVGDDAIVAAEVFSKPPRAYEFNDLPARLAGDFDARGWESRDEGFGAIRYSGRIAAAVRQFYGIDAARYDELLETVKTANGRAKNRTMTGENVEFAFWEAEPQVLMVLRRSVRQDAYDVTIALGDRSVMDLLDMTPAKAQAILDRLQGDPSGGTRGKGPVSDPTPRKATAP